jgi:hypothetical protein
VKEVSVSPLSVAGSGMLLRALLWDSLCTIVAVEFVWPSVFIRPP